MGPSRGTRSAALRTAALLAALLAVAVSAAQPDRPKGATVSLRAKWEGTPIVLEAAEFLADEGSQKFWSFIEGINSPWSLVRLWIMLEQNHPVCIKVLWTYVAMRYHSPKVEMFRSMANPPHQGACCWATIGSRNITDPSALRAAVTAAADEGSSETLYAFDHVFPAPNAGDAGLPGAVLYGAPGTSCFSGMHQALKELATQGVTRYALRPTFQRSCASELSEPQECFQLGTGEALPLPGYGVELAIKNMEYKAMDDSEIKSQGQGLKAEEIAEGEDVAGFLFGRLVQRKPEAQADLVAFRDHLLARQSSAEEETLKVWDLKDLGLQAVQRVASSSDPLGLLAEVSQNFPSLASSLSRLKVTSSLRSEVKQIQQSLPSGTNFLLLNGLMVNVDTLELYSLVERIRHDARLSDMLLAADIPEECISKLLALRPALVKSDSPEIRVSLGAKPPVSFLNNLEKDRMYSGWHSNVEMLLMPSYGGQMNPIAKNLFTCVYFVDPASPASAKVVKRLLDMWAQGLPVRMGVVLLPPQAVSRLRSAGEGAGRIQLWDDISLSEKTARAFHVLFKTHGAVFAFDFLKALADFHSDDGDDSTFDGDPYGYYDEEQEEEEDEDEDEYGGVEDEDEDGSNGGLAWEQVASAFSSAWTQAGKAAKSKKSKAAAKTKAAEVLSQLEDGSGYAQGVSDMVQEGVSEAVTRGILPSASGEPVLWFNGLLEQNGGGNALITLLQSEMRNVQMLIYQGEITDGTRDVTAAILKAGGALTRYNALILGKPKDEEVPKVKELAAGGLSAAGMDLDYFSYTGTEDQVKQVTFWVVADLDATESRALALSAARYINSAPSKRSRVAFLSCPAVTTSRRPASMCVRVVHALGSLGSQLGGDGVHGFLSTLLSTRCAEANESEEEALAAVLALAEDNRLNVDLLKGYLLEGEGSQTTVTAQVEAVCSSLQDLQVVPGRPAVITNGRYVPHLADEGGLTEEDFKLMQVYAEKNQGLAQIAEIFKPVSSGTAPGTSSDQIMLTGSLLSQLGLRDDMQTDETSLRLAAIVEQLRGKAGTLITWEANTTAKATLQVTAVVDPLTPGAQKLVSLLTFLRSWFAPSIRVWLNPKLELSEMPLKSFFRFALPDAGRSLHGQPPQQMPQAPSAVFSGLPQKKILTLNVHPPETFQRGESMVMADYELEALMITGSCIDVLATSRQTMTPRGLQLHLGDSIRPHVSDTLVMSNLGYFQLKGAPGAWSVRLAPGPSSALYDISSSTGIGEDGSMETSAAEGAAMVVVASMSGKHMNLKVRKRAGHEQDDVLTYSGADAALPQQADSEEEKSIEEEKLVMEKRPAGGGIWDRMVSMVTGGPPSAAGGAGVQRHGEVINIFTVASGHMYERLQKIMILSVLEHTQNPVKFWFIKNYMSPQMKAFLPHFARRHGFEYELVTYKWPRWLHKQTEKQRIIWAYKILFLDVLFPLKLEKVIFVDADQIIRADMKELIEMDMKGAPYAYTPFCENNKDMDGYRFWKTGFWQTHLRGLPYHISALYVVDLQRFRETAAGDQLRIIYDNLSKDPNSLANLDQDLPNYAQHQVPIHSLPQEWLWCESWCGNSTKSRAKTIDLCNNPMTKEPKLQGARRIVAEWPGYDEQVRVFTENVEAILAGDFDGGGVADGMLSPGVVQVQTDGGQAEAHDGSEL